MDTARRGAHEFAIHICLVTGHILTSMLAGFLYWALGSTSPFTARVPLNQLSSLPRDMLTFNIGLLELFATLLSVLTAYIIIYLPIAWLYRKAFLPTPWLLRQFGIREVAGARRE